MGQLKYPIGEQSFEALRKGGFLYVDKTRFIEKLLRTGKYFFLGRPRRFGKSLFLSTLKCFFQGKKDLFDGLYIAKTDWDWSSYPVIHLDLNVGRYANVGELRESLDSHFRNWEREFGVNADFSLSHGLRMAQLLHDITARHGKRVVILVDEYDKPLVNNINNTDEAEEMRDILTSLYANFKSGADYIRMVFLTGVSRFGHLSVFSGLNNLNDISFDDGFSDICGITEQELTDYFEEGIKALSKKRQESIPDTLKELKSRYDGYRFSPYGVEIYNPFSILQVMSKYFLGNYWTESGQPTLLAEMLKRFHVDLSSLIKIRCSMDDISRLDLSAPRPIALLYQTGYLTIKSFDETYEVFTLGIPNREVRTGFFSFLLPYYANLHGEPTNFYILKFVEDLREGHAEEFMLRLKTMFSSIPYDMEMNEERNIQNALLILVMLLGIDIKAEYRTSSGRIDLFIRTDRFYYIIELKFNGSTEAAIRQIDEKDYALPFAMDHQEVIRIGANFSSSQRTIDKWVIK